jgi:hypothetical protein
MSVGAQQGDAEARQGYADALPGDSEALPGDPEALPGDPEVLPGDAEALPGLILHADPEQRPAATDGVSVAAMVFGVVGLAPVAIALGVVGLVRTKRSGNGGRRLAITGITLGALWAVAFLAVFVFAVVLGHRMVSSVHDLNATQAGTGVAPNDPTAVTKAASEVEPGECLLGWDAAAGQAAADPAAGSTADPAADTGAGARPDVVVVNCRTPHQAQAFQQVDLSQTFPATAAWPGAAAVTGPGTTACQSQAGSSVDPTLAAGLSVTVIAPTTEDWAGGSRDVVCLLVAPRAELTASVTR